jgi:hypothetical protein
MALISSSAVISERCCSDYCRQKEFEYFGFYYPPLRTKSPLEFVPRKYCFRDKLLVFGNTSRNGTSILSLKQGDIQISGEEGHYWLWYDESEEPRKHSIVHYSITSSTKMFILLTPNFLNRLGTSGIYVAGEYSPPHFSIPARGWDGVDTMLPNRLFHAHDS